ncbi:hypothetical protein [Nonomuraea sp. LPB2021202275-12-8]|uniref:hypothetical protein n=1 Tax=Nonomuraea sp. LPB2021202275-12-8 TaxID=3120159 RepID=UPI00300C200A
MRDIPAELPEDPTSEQVNAWIELAELVADESFQRTVRQMVLTGEQDDLTGCSSARTCAS